MTGTAKDPAHRLVEAMARKRVGNAEVAAVAGVTATTVSKWRSGVQEIAPHRFGVVATMLGVSEAWLRGESDDDGTAVAAPALVSSQSVREYMAEAQLELVRAGLTDQEVALGLVFIQSAPWLELWRAMRGSAPSGDVLLDGMKLATHHVRVAHVRAQLDRLMIDGEGDPDQRAVLRVLARAPKEMFTPVPEAATTEGGASEGPAASTSASETSRRRA